MRPEGDRLDERLPAHPLPQSMLASPLFLGVEAPVLAFEGVALLGLVHLFGTSWLMVGLAASPLVAVHLALAAATRQDRRLSLTFSRSTRWPRYARPWATLATTPRRAEPTFPRRLLS
ncbi:MAG TPA: hypothetical protein VF017_23625 [Thermoanaerobaculia bacterium]|nr:hypothetical protein [Thermoanaerobaculia bacterium]